MNETVPPTVTKSLPWANQVADKRKKQKTFLLAQVLMGNPRQLCHSEFDICYPAK